MTVPAVVLAAGNATRMGDQKVLLPFHGMTVIEHIVRQIIKAGITEVHVVVGRDANAIRTALVHTSASVTENPIYEQGMLTSVRAGICSLGPDASGCILCLGDQPSIQSSVINAVSAKALDPDPPIVVPVYCDRRGHPIYIPSRFFDAICTSYDDVGLRGLMQEHADSVCLEPVDASWILDDTDYPEDYQRELKRLEQRG